MTGALPISIAEACVRADENPSPIAGGFDAFLSEILATLNAGNEVQNASPQQKPAATEHSMKHKKCASECDVSQEEVTQAADEHSADSQAQSATLLVIQQQCSIAQTVTSGSADAPSSSSIEHCTPHPRHAASSTSKESALKIDSSPAHIERTAATDDVLPASEQTIRNVTPEVPADPSHDPSTHETRSAPKAQGAVDDAPIDQTAVPLNANIPTHVSDVQQQTIPTAVPVLRPSPVPTESPEKIRAEQPARKAGVDSPTAASPADANRAESHVISAASVPHEAAGQGLAPDKHWVDHKTAPSKPIDKHSRPVTQERAIDASAPSGAERKAVIQATSPGSTHEDSGATARSAPTGNAITVEVAPSRQPHAFAATVLNPAATTASHHEIGVDQLGPSSKPNQLPREPLLEPLTESPIIPANVVQSVRMFDRAGNSEIHIGLNTELGHVDVRTVVHENHIGATISVENAGLGSALAAELPVLERALHSQQLDARISVHDAASGMQGGFHDQRQHHPQQQQPSPAPIPRAMRDAEPILRGEPHRDPVAMPQTSALNVRA